MGNKPEAEYSCLEWCQTITFWMSVFTVLMIVAGLSGNRSVISDMGIWFWIFLGALIIFIALQIYAIIKFGFRKSFSFLKLAFSGRGGRGGK